MCACMHTWLERSTTRSMVLQSFFSPNAGTPSHSFNRDGLTRPLSRQLGSRVPPSYNAYIQHVRSSKAGLGPGQQHRIPTDNSSPTVSKK